MLSCGEPSGELYAGALTREIRGLNPEAEVFGLAGDHVAAAGGRLTVDYAGLADGSAISTAAHLGGVSTFGRGSESGAAGCIRGRGLS